MKLSVALGVFPLLVTSSFVVAHGAESHVSLSSFPAQYEAGEEFSVTVTLEALEPITSFEIPVFYNTDFLEAASLEVNEEDFPFWWSRKAADGMVQLAASAPPPGISGEVVVATIVFQTLQAGSAAPAIEPSSALLLNAKDENILESVEKEQAEGVVFDVDSFVAPRGPSAGLLVLFGSLAAVVLVGIAIIMKKKNAAT